MRTKVINGLEIEYAVVQRRIKYPRLELKTGNLLLIVPKGYNNPEKLIEEHQEWIHNKITIIKESEERSKDKQLFLKRSDEELKEFLLNKVSVFSRELNLKPHRITLRYMKSKWGSCSSKKNLNFNKLLKYLPNELIEYVILHEIAHLKEKKHGEWFWQIISTKFSDYKEKESDLMDYWFLIQSLNKFDKKQ